MLVRIFFHYVNFIHCNRIQEVFNHLPRKIDRCWGIQHPELIEPSSVICGNCLERTFQCIDWQICQAHASKIVDNIPALDLAGDEHFFDDFLLHKNDASQHSFWVFKVSFGEIEDDGRPKVVVPAADVIESCILSRYDNYNECPHFLVTLILNDFVSLLITHILPHEGHVVIHRLVGLFALVFVGRQEQHQHVGVEVVLIVLVLGLHLQELLHLGQLLLLEVVMLDLAMEVHSAAIGLIEVVFFLLVQVDAVSTDGEESVGSLVKLEVLILRSLGFHQIYLIIFVTIIIFLIIGRVVEPDSGDFLLSEEVLGPFIGCNSERVGDDGADQTGLNSKPEPLDPLLFIDLLCAINESAIRHNSVLLITPCWQHLNFGFDDVLGVRENPAAHACHRPHKATFPECQHLVVGARQSIFKQLVGRKLGSISRDFPSSSSKSAPEQSPGALPSKDIHQALVAAFELAVVQLHPALDQLDWAHHERVDEPSEGSIFNPIKQAQLVFMGHFLIELVAAKHDRVDQRDCNQRIINPIEQLHHSPLSPHLFQVTCHGHVRVHLHLHFQRIKDVPRQTVSHSRNAATQEIPVPLQLSHC